MERDESFGSISNDTNFYGDLEDFQISSSKSGDLKKVNNFSDVMAEISCENYYPSPVSINCEIENFKTHPLLNDNHLKEIDPADVPSVLHSLQEMNMKVMTQICDVVQTQPSLLNQVNGLGNLVSIRKKVLQQIRTAKTLSTTSSFKVCNSASKAPDFQMVHTAKDLTNETSFASTSTSTPETQYWNTIKIKTEPLFLWSDSPSTSLSSVPISNPTPNLMSANNLKMSTVPAFSEKSTDFSSPHSFSSTSSHQDTLNSKNAFDTKSSDFKFLNYNNVANASIKIEDVETQNLLEDSIYEIDGDMSIAPKCEGSDAEKDKILTGKFYVNQRDDSTSNAFKGFNFPFSNDLRTVFHNVFGLKMFLHNQLEAINAAMLKEDCFILMPPGGGKSLCYQLPALVCSGVTIVVSPLRSLIMDQVQKLNSLNINAHSLTGNADASTENYVYRQLSSREPSLKLLYVTPEKISASMKLITSLEELYSRKMIHRFVIEEAHCVSQWGHDFRPDYKCLKVLRDKFPEVPMMALTAIATQRVRMDILHQLGMKSPKWFLQSFNRPNLKYEVRPKTKSVVKDIIGLIKSKFKNMCGIVYCLSRNDCDLVASELCNYGISASSYHAEMNNRNEVQEAWIKEKFKVICAAIAFGMSIDKPDVRFVIHHTIPKSIEGYYQESGRAGRDGEISWCILFYAYKDMTKIKRMVMEDNSNKQMWNTHLDNLYRMVHYCENRTDCRRVCMLTYFGERFYKKLCLKNIATACDNCFTKQVYEMRDVTEDAKAIIQCVVKIVDARRRKNYTIPHFVDIYKGSKTQKVLSLRHDKLELFGKGRHLQTADCERLLRKLVLDQYLYEDLYINQMDVAVSFVYLGKHAKELMTGNIKVIMPFQKGTKNKFPLANLEPIEDLEIRQLIEKCYNELIEVSKVIASERKLHYTNVINVEALRQMSREMPMTEEGMLAIPHVTKAVYKKYGKQFLEVTARYAAERSDNDILNALVEKDDWSDAEPPSHINNTRQGQKRKRFAQGGQFKRAKTGYFRRKWPKGTAKERKNSASKAKTASTRKSSQASYSTKAAASTFNSRPAQTFKTCSNIRNTWFSSY